MSKTTNKQILFILAAIMMVALVAFSACDNATPFEPTFSDGISGSTPVGNGGIAVQYGDYIYYVNGYQSANDANNDYTNEVRTGSIVRIKASAIDGIIALNDESLSSKEITERIASAVKENVQLVVPCFYFSGNTTNKDITGLYIFNDRLYITTPNQALTNGGKLQHYQLVLRSYKLDGSDEQEHFVFKNPTTATNSTTATEILLSQVDNQVYATYVLDGDLHSLKVNAGSASEDKVVVEDVTSAKIDGANNVVFYLDKDGQICQFNAGATEGKVLVEKVDTDASKLTYTISAVSDGYVYYTQADSVNPTLDGKTIFYAHFDGTSVVKGSAVNAVPGESYIGWGSKLLRVRAEDHTPSTAKTYHVEAVYVDENGNPKVDELFTNRKAVTLSKIEKGVLYFVVDGVSYTRDLSSASPADVAYAKNLSDFQSQGWETADIVGKYIFAFNGTNVTVASFDATENTNSKVTTITLVAEEDAE